MEATDKASSTLVFYVNGKKVVEQNADPETTLLQYLRNRLHLSGTKLGCGEGGCGACTVMVSTYDRQRQMIVHMSVNACLAPLCSMHGLSVTTVEGIGSTKTRLHPVQERLAKSHGSQCGFCTPGIVMSMYTLLRNNPQPSWKQMESAFEGNLCRCTGYRPILEGFKTFTKDYCSKGANCCMNKQNGTNGGCGDQNGVDGSEGEISTELFKPSEFLPYDPTQEPIFPPELQLSEQFDAKGLVFQGERATWYRPVTLTELLDLKSKYPTAKLVVGNTEIGVELKLKNMHYPVVIAPTLVPEMRTVTYEEGGIRFGANTTLSRLEQELNNANNNNNIPGYKTRMFAAIIEMLRWFAGHQIRNVAAISGNVMTASPISDLNPLFLAAGCIITVTSKDGGERSICMDSKFFVSYRKTVVKPDEVMLSILIPYTRQNEYFCGYKQAQRREDDIAIVNAGMRVLFEGSTNVVKEAAFAFGGMAPTTVMATDTAKKIVGCKWTDSLVTEVCSLLAAELPLPPGVPGGMSEYRRTLTTSLFFKFYLTVQLRLTDVMEKPNQTKVLSSYKSATSIFNRECPKSSQLYQETPAGQAEDDAVGRPIAHMAAAQQTTGEAIYCDDIPSIRGELYLALVLSTKPLAQIVNIDTSMALKMPGVETFVSHEDVPCSNMYGSPACDEEIFAKEMVKCQGQVIGAIVADTQVHAQRAAKAVKVTYEEFSDRKPVITIEQAVEANSFYLPCRTISCGNVTEALNKSYDTIEGEVRIGGQEHFYLETNACIVVPKEEKEVEVFCSCQHPSEGQEAIAHALGIPANRVVVKVKRMGGGFGGKETRFLPLLLAASVAANKVGRPVRCMLDRDEDMVLTGNRHPFMGKYKVGFTDKGKITALDVQLYSNAGHSQDLSLPVVERGMFHIDNAYKIPNLCVKGFACKTNIPSNTAFRGFGGPQGMFVCETIVSDVARKLGMSPEQVRQMNLYQEGELTHFNQPMTLCNLERCWQQCMRDSEFESRRKDVDIFNSENRWRKKGISVTPTKFGISYTALFLNQAGALVHVYKDGSVLVTHGGTEMGQGLHTKMIQVASRALKIPTSRIYISETSTDKVPNTSATAASASSDLNGMAILNACETIMERLQPYIAANPKGSWEDWVITAYFDRVSLSSTGFYRTPNIGYDFEKNAGKPFGYFTQGVACSEVEIDCLTGDHQVLRTDIVMDVGTSLNPAIDIGQIEGGFTQGYGLFTLEQPKISPDGFNFTRGPGSYKIPGFGDIPLEFNVALLAGSVNPRAVYSSKAIGEPPFFLASSVFFAIKDAITSARADAGHQDIFRLDSPATAEKIRMACIDQFTEMFPPADKGSFKPWTVDL